MSVSVDLPPVGDAHDRPLFNVREVSSARSSRLADGVRHVSALTRRAYQPRRVVRSLLEDMAGRRLVGGSAELAIRRLSTRQPRVFPLAEALRILDAIEAAGVRCWLGGGWGIDALAGGQSRVHRDLDLVLDDFEGAIHAASEVVERLGYRPRPPHETGIWLPQAVDFEASECRVELLGVNWSLLASVIGLLDPGRDGTTVRDAFRASCLTRGRLGTRTVPCLSVAAQTLFHTGYRHRETDWLDVDLLSTLGRVVPQPESSAAATALLIPTFDFDARAGELWRQLNGASTLPPHITLLFPFLPLSRVTPEIRFRLGAAFASEPPFDYRLVRVGWFDRRVTYLEPAPRERFSSLVERLSGEFGVRPYGGAFGEVVPHLTLAEGGPERRLRHAAVRMTRSLPQQCRAGEAWLLAESGGRWRIAARFPLGAAVEEGAPGSPVDLSAALDVVTPVAATAVPAPDRG